MRKLILLSFTVVAAIATYAQKRITLQPGVAFVNGKESNASQPSLDVYYRLRMFNIGLGTALDRHYLQSVPIYVATQKIIGQKNVRLVAYANGGLNIPAPRENQKITDSRFTGEGRYKTGYYYDFGGGLAIMLSRSNALLFTCGFSGKAIQQVYNEAYRWGDFVPPDETQKHTFRYSQQRIVVRVKLQI